MQNQETLLHFVLTESSNSRDRCLIVFANQATNYTLNLNPFRCLNKDGFELWISGFETNEIWLTIKLLHRRIVSINQGDYDLAILSSLL